jgi:sulfite oxidase
MKNRSTGSLPEVDPALYRLRVTGMVARTLELSLGDLRTRFAEHDLTAAVVCAGNRRSELMAVRPMPHELPWGADAISTARWRGVRLADVLHAAGIGPAVRHVAFTGLDQACVEGATVPFGASIPLEKALSPEVLLVHTMNGAPLPREHGFPLRVLVPGYVGARNVKWLRDITLQRERPALVQGYAITGEAPPVQRVEISLDGGATWTAAGVKDSGRWSWCFWKATVNLPPGDREIVVRAWDAAGRTQPADVRPLWNFKGYANNAWHRVHVSVR